MVKFLRRAWNEYSKLGMRRKKMQKWRKPTGRDNKMREKRKGYTAMVSIGYSTDNSIKGKIKEKTPVMVNNIKDLDKVNKESIAIIGAVGKKKKIEILKAATEKKIEVANINTKKFLRKVDKENKK